MATQEKLSLMRDLLEHMGTCCEAWQAAGDQKEALFASYLRRDLTEFRRLCESLLCDRSAPTTVGRVC